jgi:hypothetical protein
MATPADQRLLELCDKWLKSLELHTRYAGLDTDSYWRVQPWPEHQRPSRWILDVAIQKATALRSQVQERTKQGDTKFSDALELMTFLANLIGSEHIERFIPLADPENERDLRSPTPDAEAAAPRSPAVAPVRPAIQTTRPAAPAATPSGSSDPIGDTATREMPLPAMKQKQASEATATREMPQFAISKRRAPPPVGTQQVARAERKGAQSKPSTRTPARQPAKLAAAEDEARDQVIADAARLVQWGRKWYELAELIARMAGRPALAEVRRILKDNKTAIDRKAGGK